MGCCLSCFQGCVKYWSGCICPTCSFRGCFSYPHGCCYTFMGQLMAVGGLVMNVYVITSCFFQKIIQINPKTGEPIKGSERGYGMISREVDWGMAPDYQQCIHYPPEEMDVIYDAWMQWAKMFAYLSTLLAFVGFVVMCAACCCAFSQVMWERWILWCYLLASCTAAMTFLMFGSKFCGDNDCKIGQGGGYAISAFFFWLCAANTVKSMAEAPPPPSNRNADRDDDEDSGLYYDTDEEERRYRDHDDEDSDYGSRDGRDDEELDEDDEMEVLPDDESAAAQRALKNQQKKDLLGDPMNDDDDDDDKLKGNGDAKSIFSRKSLNGQDAGNNYNANGGAAASPRATTRNQDDAEEGAFVNSSPDHDDNQSRTSRVSRRAPAVKETNRDEDDVNAPDFDNQSRASRLSRRSAVVKDTDEEDNQSRVSRLSRRSRVGDPDGPKLV